MNQVKLSPLHDRIIVKPEEKEKKTPSGILLPDTAQEKPQRGKVIAVGPGKLLDNGKIAPMEVKPGDVVLYGKYSGTEVTVDGDEYVILRQDDVLAIIEGAPAAKEVAKKGGK
ncbi:MAG: co-chaperone GroES [Fimbriimonadales bacterium]|nr:co-chaperone GroES [Fimbriimonadales bacterium]